MLTALRKRLSYANVTATLALLFAMSGGALAASHYLVTSTKQIKPSVLKQLIGKAGTAGPQGQAGPAGVAGAGSPGPQGPAGPAGRTGETGAAGAPGKEGTPGKEGKAGKEGSPWTAGGTLPSGKTETGVWQQPKGAGGAGQWAQISFPIPLAQPLVWSENKPGEPEDQVHYINPSAKEVPTPGEEVASHPDCPGNVAKPEALPGNLCIYAKSAPTESLASNEIIYSAATGSPGAATSGALLIAEGFGTWAVTPE